MKNSPVQDGCENVFGRLGALAGDGNSRNFGALQFRRLLKRYILGRGNTIPLQPNSPVEDVKEPLLSLNVTEELYIEEETETITEDIEIPDDFFSEDFESNKIEC